MVQALGVRPTVAVVLAAGRSDRLSAVTGGTSKTLLPIAGLTLMERTLLRP